MTWTVLTAGLAQSQPSQLDVEGQGSWRKELRRLQGRWGVFLGQEDVDSWEDPRFSRGVCEFSVED